MISFQNPYVIYLIIPLGFIILFYIRPRGIKNILLVASKLFIIFIILLSIASPYTVAERPGLKGSQDITVIADKTESMRLFNTSFPDYINNYLGDRTSGNIDIISGAISPIGDNIIGNIKSGGNILLISDGNSNYGRSIPDAINFARSLNATIYLVNQEPIKKDMRVSIKSDIDAIVDNPFDFLINIETVGVISGRLEVRVDDRVVYDNTVIQPEQIPITASFKTTGSHTIRAELVTGPDDEIPQNNVFYRSVHVLEKPRILLVSKGDSPLSGILSQSYSLDTGSDLANITEYRAVILDDISAKELSDNNALHIGDYVADGGGLIVVGGPGAYSDYSERPLFDQLLPVGKGGVPQQKKSAGIVLVLDISGSSDEFSGDNPKLDIEKGLALQVVDSLDASDFMGIIAFNNAPHTIIPFSRYGDRPGIKDTVSRLASGGKTRLSPALAAARDMVKNFQGGKNIIVISDGIVDDSDSSLKEAGSIAGDGIIIYAIGIGGNMDEGFMKRLAAAGGGSYLSRNQKQGIKLLFGEMETRNMPEGYPLVIINNEHFITKGVTLDATVYGYNNVFSRRNAQAIITTANGNPVITTWKYGLGRVVSITVDNGNEWAPALYNINNSKIILASTNYAIGSPSRGFEIFALDGETGRPIDVRVVSDGIPDLRFDSEKIQFENTGERTYHAELTANSTGFHDISGYLVAVNYPSEFRDIGNNDMVSGMIAAAGGRVYNESEVGQLIPDIAKKNTTMVQEVVDLGPLFLFAALLLYVIEIILRRLVEIFKS